MYLYICKDINIYINIKYYISDLIYKEKNER